MTDEIDMRYTERNTYARRRAQGKGGRGRRGRLSIARGKFPGRAKSRESPFPVRQDTSDLEMNRFNRSPWRRQADATYRSRLAAVVTEPVVHLCVR